MNATGWRSALRRLERTSAQVVMVQETKVLARDVPRLSAQAARRGWQTIWSPALPGKGGKARGGVAICAKSPVALSRPPRGPSDVIRGRVAAAMIEAPGCRPTVCYCGYLKDGVGANAENLSYLANVGAHWGLQPEGVQKILGADFNFSPQLLAETGFPEDTDSVIVNPGGGATTCRTARSASLIDFFVVSKGMAEGVQSVTVVERSGIKTHAPVLLRFHPRLTSLKALALRKPPVVGTQLLIGPRMPPPNWEPLVQRLRIITGKAMHGGRAAIDDDYQKAFEDWADLAEQELHRATGQPVVKAGLRGRLPRLQWRSILPEKVDARASNTVVAVRALASLLVDLRRCRGETAEWQGIDDVTMMVEVQHLIEQLAMVCTMPGADVLSPFVARATRLAEELRGLTPEGGGSSSRSRGGGNGDTHNGHDSSAVQGHVAHHRFRRDGTILRTSMHPGARQRSTYCGEDLGVDPGPGHSACGFDMEEDPLADINDHDDQWDGHTAAVVGDGPDVWQAPSPPGLYDGDSEEEDDHGDEGEHHDLAGDDGASDDQLPWHTRIRNLTDDVTRLEDVETRAELKVAIGAWSTWIKENAHRGLRHAHLHTRPPPPCATTAL